MISIIAAVASDNGLGKDNELLWNIPEDLRRFKKLTLGKCVIMGKRTWLSLPRRPLPDRKNIVLTDIPGECIDCSVTAYSVDDALGKCGKDEDIFIIGGGSVYRQFMNIADRLLITHVHQTAPADTWFPEIDPDVWEIKEKEDHESDAQGNPSYTYIIYERKNT